MDIRKLTQAFYDENKHLKEVLDKTGGLWNGEKTRGYGVVIIDINSLKFGIPFRSEIKHKHSFITKANKGLDYQKAVLLEKDEYISKNAFKIPEDELELVKSKKFEIESSFAKYVRRYVEAHERNIQTTLQREYKFTTLINYHGELGISIPTASEIIIEIKNDAVHKEQMREIISRGILPRKTAGSALAMDVAIPSEDYTEVRGTDDGT